MSKENEKINNQTNKFNSPSELTKVTYLELGTTNQHLELRCNGENDTIDLSIHLNLSLKTLETIRNSKHVNRPL